MSGLTFLSVCSGIESASSAWEPLGFRAVGFAEIEPFPSAVLAHHYGSNMPGEPLSQNGIPNHGDFTAIDLSKVPKPLDILVGGTPCQAFSVAGKRQSLTDARGNLTLAYVVLAHELVGSHGLRNAVWENVPGVLSTDDNAFGCFLGALVGADDALLPCERPDRGKSNRVWRWREAGRWPVLDDEGEETGEFVERPEGHVARWPGFGMAAGPLARVAWGIRDAQYFGLAQRRRRVFLVADFGGGADPAAVLFEPKGVRGNTPPRREAGKGAAAHAARGAGERRAVGFGGGRTSGPVEQAACLTANGGGQAMDFEVETFLVETANTLGAKKDGGWRGDLDNDTYVVHALRGEGFDASTGTSGYAGRRQEDDDNLVAIPFDTTQITSPGNYSKPVAGEPCHPLAAGAHPPAVAVEEPYVLMERGRSGKSNLEFRQDGTANALLTPNGGRGGFGVGAIATSWAVRRLTPTECERLQGFPDGHTAIAWNRKPAEECPDGPRYRALGNSKAVPVVKWIGQRLKLHMPERQP